jgi:hypothetical protein
VNVNESKEVIVRYIAAATALQAQGHQIIRCELDPAEPERLMYVFPGTAREALKAYHAALASVKTRTHSELRRLGARP